MDAADAPIDPGAEACLQVRVCMRLYLGSLETTQSVNQSNTLNPQPNRRPNHPGPARCHAPAQDARGRTAGPPPPPPERAAAARG
jgi:hypothetical protein